MGTELVEALKALHFAMATSSNDWGASPGGACLYGIVLGWDGDPDEPDDEGAWGELATRWGWSDATVARLKAHHAAIEAATSADAGWVLLPPGGEVEQEWRISFVNRNGDRTIWERELSEEKADQELAVMLAEGRWQDARKESRTTITLSDGRQVIGLWDPPW